MKSRLFSLIAHILILGFATSAGAGEGQWTLGVSGGVSRLEPETGNTGFVRDDVNDAAVRVSAGYDVTDNWSIEGFYSYLGEATFIPAAALEYEAFGLAGQYSWPDNRDGLAIFLRAGANSIEHSSDIAFRRLDDMQYYGGVGVEFHLNHRFSLRAEADYYDEDAQYFGIGLKLKLGGKPRTPRATDDGFGPDIDVRETTHTPEVVDPVPAPAPVIPDPVPTAPEDAAPAVVMQPGISRVLDGVTFEFGSPRLTPQSRVVLDEIVSGLIAQPELKVKVDGHTDNVGNASYNRRLSLLRARSVAHYLVQNGVERHRVKYAGFGGERPRADNSTERGRELNRRVEILAY